MTRCAIRTWPHAQKSLLILVAAIALSAAVAGQAGSQEAPAEHCLVGAANAGRAQAGSPLLIESPELARIAQQHAEQMAAQGQIFHNPELRSQMPPGSRGLGENVGQATTCEQMHGLFMESAVHQANIMRSDFNYVGIGQAADSQGQLFFVQDFGIYSSVPSRPARPPGDWTWIWPWSYQLPPPWPWILPGTQPAPHPATSTTPVTSQSPSQPLLTVNPGQDPVRPPGDWTWLWPWNSPTPPPWPWILPGNQPLAHPAVLFAPPPAPDPLPPPVEPATGPAPIAQRTLAYSALLEKDPELLLEPPFPAKDEPPSPSQVANIELDLTSREAVFSLD